MVRSRTLVALSAFAFGPVYGIDLDVNSADSIKSAASTIASGMVSFYNGNETGQAIGVLDPPYYWWEAGAMFDTLIQYWHFTGDTQYNGIVSQALVAQQGENSDFMPANQSANIGNDDQGVWASAAMSAAEAKFPQPQGTTWSALAEAVFNEQVVRWDTQSCNGGLRWQIFPFNTGYNYKNSVSNGHFFHLASHLARYTGNSTYSDWATKVFDWTQTIGFVDNKWNVFDGGHTGTNCSDINKVQFSSNHGLYIDGAAHMYNITTGDSQKKWKVALDGLLNTTLTLFFPSGVATEIACEKLGTCNVDMRAFKGLLAQSLVETIQVAPYTSSVIKPLLTSSAQAAAKACTGTSCAFVWSGTSNSTITGVGEQLSALSFVQGLLVGNAASPVTETTGGGNSTTTGAPGSATKTGAPSSATSNVGVALGYEKMAMGMGLFGSMMALIM